jgi:hypothetical protein
MDLDTPYTMTSKDILCGVTRSTTGGNSCGTRRKLSRWDQSEGSNRSSGSLLTTMEKFVQTVEDMNETILVPCRLMDAKFDQAAATPHGDPKGRLLSNLSGVDLYQFYSMLNSVKNDLMWGNKSQQMSSNGQTLNGTTISISSDGIMSSSSTPSEVFSTSSLPSLPSSASTTSTSSVTSTSTHNGTGGGEVKGHARRPSTVSTTSSTSASDTEFSELNDDSGVEGEEEYSQHMADSFHHHLNGLQQCLKDLTLAADYVTNRYNNDLGGLNL